MNMETKDNTSLRLKLNFKGQREYVQGGDIFNAAVRVLKNEVATNSWVKSIIFRRFAYYDCDLDLSSNVKYDPKKLVASIIVSTGGGIINGAIIESDRQISNRIEFDEEKIFSVSVIENRAIKQLQPTVFSPVEVAIALTKKLHNKVFPLSTGKWVFSELHLLQDFSGDVSKYCVAIKQSLGGRMTISEIQENELTIGKIKFIVAQI